MRIKWTTSLKQVVLCVSYLSRLKLDYNLPCLISSKDFWLHFELNLYDHLHQLYYSWLFSVFLLFFWKHQVLFCYWAFVLAVTFAWYTLIWFSPELLLVPPVSASATSSKSPFLISSHLRDTSYYSFFHSPHFINRPYHNLSFLFVC